jgi:uncharacterized phiE125 gp8 family phage protein
MTTPWAARKLIVAPTLEPLALGEAKAHLLYAAEDQDSLISSLIATARRSIENETGRAIMPQTWDFWYDGFPCDSDQIKLPLGGLRSISVFEWTDSAGAARSWTPSGNPTSALLQSGTTRAHVSTEAEPGVIRLAYGQTWPADTLRTLNSVRIRGEWGYTAVPPDLVHAMKLLVGHWFINREEVVAGTKSSVDTRPLTRGVQSLVYQYKVRF